MLCLVNPVNDRVLRLLNSVKSDSSLFASQLDIWCLQYAFSAPWQVNSLLQLQIFFLRMDYLMQLQFATFSILVVRARKGSGSRERVCACL